MKWQSAIAEFGKENVAFHYCMHGDLDVDLSTSFQLMQFVALLLVHESSIVKLN